MKVKGRRLKNGDMEGCGGAKWSFQRSIDQWSQIRITLMRIRIRNRNKVKSWIRIRIKVKRWIQIRIKVKRGIRIHIIVFRIRNTAFDFILLKIKIHPVHLLETPYGIVNAKVKS
jgi:hypothetical protein